MTIYGVDMALSHFAIVDETGRVICGQANTNTMDSSPDDLKLVAQTAVSYLPMGAVIAVDWDVNIGSFGSKKPGQRNFNNPKVGVIITAQIMCFAGIAYEAKQADIQFFTPAEVRKCLGLPVRMKKEDVHKAVWDTLPVNLRGKCHPLKDVRGDMIDAYLLASVYNCARKR